MLRFLKNFISYWYMRYLLLTELFMVEKWERHMFHIVAGLFFFLLSVINNTVVLNAIRMVTSGWFSTSESTSPVVSISINSEL